MSAPTILSDVTSWARAGNGLELQFYAIDSEVADWLQRFLPPEYAPYYLVGSDLVGSSRKNYEEVPFRFELADFPACAHPTDRERFNFWLLSERVTPALRAHAGHLVEGFYSCNGLIELQHGWRLKVKHLRPEISYQQSSRIAILNRIQNLKTGEIRTNETAYMEVFRLLRRAIKRELVYCTVLTFPDGHEEEDCRTALMTEKAAQAYWEGFPFLSAPGRTITEAKRKK
jgi:hypothetical protein